MRKLRLLKASLFAASALLVANPAMAQPEDHHDMHEEIENPEQPVDPNAIRGTLEPVETPPGTHRVPMQAGQRYALTVNSEVFDPILRILRPGSTEVLVEDDDSGGGVTPRIHFTPETSGEYVVQVASFNAGGAGDYALSVNERAPLPALITRPTRNERSQWQVYQGNLSAGSVDEGRRFQDFTLQLAAGETAMIHVQGDADTMLQVFTAADRGNVPLVENDDGGGGTNPFLFFAPDEAGTYVVRVIGFSEEANGPFRLRIGK